MSCIDLLLPNAHVLFAFSDSAGANACLAQAFTLKAAGMRVILMTNNPAFQSNLWRLEVIYQEQPEPPLSNQIDLVFTGTSHPTTSTGFELKLIAWANTQNIPSVSFVDHWTNFAKRFTLDSQWVLPTEIWVCDEEAMKQAVREGLPASRLKIKANPYHTYLSANWRSSYPNRTYAPTLGIPSDRTIVLLAPDPVSLREETRSYGFNEQTALIDLLGVFSRLPTYPLYYVIKAHPLQPPETLESIAQLFIVHGLSTKLLREANNLELISLSEVVIGFYSNFLLDAQALHKKVLRYFPGDPLKDPLHHRQDLPAIGNTDKAFVALQHLLKPS